MDKLLKSPNSANIEVGVGLKGVALVAIVEVLVPRVVGLGFGGTPIVVVSKTANHRFLQIQLVQLIF